MFSFSITTEQRDIRVDAFLASQIDDLTRSRVQELIRKELITVNGRSAKSGYRLKRGDEVRVVIPPAAPYELKGETVEFSIIHEDASLIVLDKPPGLVIHPAPGHSKGTLVHGLLQHCDDLSGIGGVLRPGIVHRLDKDTSGLVVVAKNDHAYQFLAEQFKGRTIRKEYLATVCGIPAGTEGEIDLPIARHPKRRKEMSVQPSLGKRALTLWQKLEEFKQGFSLLSVILKTGRTHQIRVHLSYMGYPVLGDPVYGYKRNWWKKRLSLMDTILPHVKRQQLHAERLGFVHPDSGNYCEFNAPLPDDMRLVLKALGGL
ncbi:MAG: RluA family pseudouridine synthase [Deltaproteobacteria bacterium]|nr:RluA family pseudouridine synthase [Deltaproteobacteria bacterium]